MSTTHQSAWRSKAIDFLEGAEQFTVAFGRGQYPSDSCGDGGHGGTETQSPVEFADEVQLKWEGQRGKEAGTKVKKLAHSMASNPTAGKSASTARSTAEVIALPRLDNGAVPSVEQWASQIRSLWANGTANTLELARFVC